jgi:hypothetical protein
MLLPKPIRMGVSVAECSVPVSNGKRPRSTSIVGKGGEGEPARRRYHVPPVGCGVSFFSVGVEGAEGLWCFEEEEESGGVFLCVCLFRFFIRYDDTRRIPRCAPMVPPSPWIAGSNG